MPAPRSSPRTGRAATIETGAKNNEPSFISRLREYKEFIAILTFFLGGIYWLYAMFVTKIQLNETQCLLRSDVELIGGQLQMKILADEVISLDGEIERLTKLTNATNVDDRNDNLLKRKILERQIQRDRLGDARKKSEEVLVSLRSDACSRSK